MSEILFKSKISPLYKGVRFVLLFPGVLFLIGSMYFFNILFSPSIDRIFMSFGGFLRHTEFATFGMLGISLFFFWWGLQYFGSYLIIHENGIKIRKPYRFFFHKFIPWSAIKEITLEYIGIRSVGGRKRSSRKYETFHAIFVTLLNSKKTLKIEGMYVDPIEDAYNLMKDHINPFEVLANERGR